LEIGFVGSVFVLRFPTGVVITPVDLSNVRKTGLLYVGSGEASHDVDALFAETEAFLPEYTPSRIVK